MNKFKFNYIVFQCPLCDIQLLTVGGFFRPLFFFRLLTVFVSPPRGAQYDILVDFFKVEDVLLGFVVIVTLLADDNRLLTS